jgi:signal transduction histidine kinase
VVTAVAGRPDTPERVRRLAEWVAGAVVVLVVATVDGGVSVPADRLWLVLPAGAAALVAPPRHRAFLLAGCAAFVAGVSTGESVQLGLAAGALVFLATCRDPAGRPWLGAAGGAAGATAALAVALSQQRGLYLQPFVLVAAGYLLAALLRSWSRNRAVTREAAGLRDRAAWLEQRTDLARELHDVVGHHVTAMVVQAEAGQLGPDPASALRRIADSGRTALQDLDTLVVHLRDPDAGLAASRPPRLSDIDELLARPLRRQGVTVHVDVDAEPGLDAAGALAAYRIAQEALTNVARHAAATTVWVSLQRVGGDARLRVGDDGVGVAGPPARGSGLLGVAERVAALGGRWHLGPRPGGGTLLEVTLPVAGP